MRRSGLWHAELVKLIVSMRHHDILVIGDAGLPVPEHVRTIDLGWRRGEPGVLPVLGEVLRELVVERATVAREANDEGFLAGLWGQLDGLPIDRVTHEDLKTICGSARAVVRTGEATPYTNVVLHAGVSFGVAAPREGTEAAT